MKSLGLSNPVTGGLALGCVLLGGAVLHEVLAPPFPASATPQGTLPGDDLRIAEPRRWSMAPVTAFAIVTERPLFTPGRRPPQAKSEADDAGQSVEAPALTLSAVVTGPHHRLALIEQADGATLLLSEGDAVGEWQLAEIHAEHVVFQSGRHVQRFYLRDMPVEAMAGEGSIDLMDAAVSRP